MKGKAGAGAPAFSRLSRHQLFDPLDLGREFEAELGRLVVGEPAGHLGKHDLGGLCAHLPEEFAGTDLRHFVSILKN